MYGYRDGSQPGQQSNILEGCKKNIHWCGQQRPYKRAMQVCRRPRLTPSGENSRPSIAWPPQLAWMSTWTTSFSSSREAPRRGDKLSGTSSVKLTKSSVTMRQRTQTRRNKYISEARDGGWILVHPEDSPGVEPQHCLLVSMTTVR